MCLEQSCDDGIYINGDDVFQFERMVAHYFSTSRACFVSSGSSALYLALKTLGIANGDEVIIPCMSWISTAHAVSRLGATPVFTEINRSFNMDICSLEEKISMKTKAIMPVHFGGIPAEMHLIMKLARERNLFVIEDASQSFGNELDGQMLGTFGDFGCFSLNPMKTFGALGEAGLVVSQNDKLINNLRQKIYSGLNNMELNHRGDNLQARFLKVLLENFGEKQKKLKIIFDYYKKHLNSQVELVGKKNNYIPYCINILVDQREAIEQEFGKREIEFKRLHVPLMVEHPCYRHNTSLPKSNEIAKKLLSLPYHQHLTENEVVEICSVINEACK
jgi:UDP-2-acetamido-2-deoxy-ribo-hexuluronate aminotransferase